MVSIAQTTIPDKIIATSNTTFYFFAAIHTSIESSDPPAAALADVQAAVASVASLMPEHVSAWGRLWTSGVEIAGRDDVAMVINARY